LKISLKVFLVVALFMFTFGVLSENTIEASGSVVVYTPVSEDVITTLIPMFEEQTGIRVELITAGTGELVRRLQTEQHNPYADVMFGASPATLVPVTDLFAEYVSPNDEYMLDNAKNEDGIFTPWTADGSVILVNTDLLDELGIEINGYADLLQPELKGRIMHGDPAASSSAYYQVTNMLLAMGDGEDYFNEDAWDYVEKLIQNLDGKVASGSGVVHRSVADGEYVVGLTWEDPAASWVRDGAPVKIVYPEEGVVFMNSTIAKVKGGPNPENAQKFIDFIISEEAQSALGTQLTNRPLRAGIELGDHMFPMEEMNLLYESQEKSMENREAVAQKYIDILIQY